MTRFLSSFFLLLSDSMLTWKLEIGEQSPKGFVCFTVDGSEIPNNHLGCIKSVVSNGINYQPQQTGDRRISEPSTVFLEPFGIPCHAGKMNAQEENQRPLGLVMGWGVPTFGKNRSFLKGTIYWLVVSNMFYFHPENWGRLIPILTSIFVKWVGSTTN